MSKAAIFDIAQHEWQYAKALIGKGIMHSYDRVFKKKSRIV